jgi:predicted dehydrogenase
MMKEHKELRIALIGLGTISKRHMTVIENLNKLGYNLKVVAAAEIDETKLKAFGEKYGIADKDLYQDFREMLKRDDIDEVEVMVHNNLHTSVATAVMAAGFPCYCEKPMAASYADAKILYDAQKKYGQKLAVQISSIYNPQTRIAKQMIEEGKLGDIYHVRTVGHRRQGRPGYDMPTYSHDFIDPEIGVHGPLFDLGIYHLAQMLYVLGMPELESVYGVQSSRYWTDERIDKAVNRTAPVEDLGVGIARFKGGLSMDIYEDWAIHMDEIGSSFIAGSQGGLKFTDVDTSGGVYAVPENGIIVGAGAVQKPRLEWFGVDEHASMFETKLDCAIGDLTGKQEVLIHPEIEMYNDNQIHWYSYLRGDLTDESRIDSPYIAMMTAYLSEGIVISNELGRSVTAEEIKTMSKSIAIREQKTSFGTITYDFDDYKAD